MSVHWSYVHLKDYCTKIGSGSTPKGGANVYLDNGDTCLIRSQNIYNDGFNESGLVYISDVEAIKLNNVKIEENDILINITGDSVARVCLVPKDKLPARVNQHVAIIRTIQNELNSKFVRYFLVDKKTQNLLLGLAATGATRNALTKGMLENILVPKPDIKIQQKIAKILSDLDDKIHLNNQINQTLESIAQAIFKSWFIDFEPVKAKIAAKQNGKDPERAAMCAISGKSEAELELMPKDDFAELQATAALFPDELVDSELGEVPRGWEVKALDEIAHYQNGLALQKFRPENENDFLPIVKIAQLKSGVATTDEKASPNIDAKSIIDDGDVVFSWSGSLVVDIWCGGKAALNQHLFKVTSNQYPKWLYYYYTKHHLAEFQRIAEAKAVTMGHIKREHLSQALCAIPCKNLLKINGILESLLNKQIKLRLENQTLIDIRDTLLPKLLSGEIDVDMV